MTKQGIKEVGFELVSSVHLLYSNNRIPDVCIKITDTTTIEDLIVNAYQAGVQKGYKQKNNEIKQILNLS